jgi:hypothetical protein
LAAEECASDERLQFRMLKIGDFSFGRQRVYVESKDQKCQPKVNCLGVRALADAIAMGNRAYLLVAALTTLSIKGGKL